MYAMNVSLPIFDVAMESLGGDAHVMVPHWQALKKALRSGPAFGVPNGIDECVFILRVDGSLGSFGGDGVDRVRLQMAKRYIQVDVCLPVERWRERPWREIASFIAVCVVGSCAEIARKAKRMDKSYDPSLLVETLRDRCDRLYITKQNHD